MISVVQSSGLQSSGVKSSVVQNRLTTASDAQGAAPVLLAVALLASSLAGAPQALHAQDIPAHPSQLQFSELEFAVPRAEKYRHELPSGIPVYVVEDHALPLVDVNVQVRVGTFLEPAQKVGLAGLTGSLLRKSGTKSLSPKEMDERADFLAADLSSGIGDTSGRAGINCLSNVLEECLDLFFEMLREPRFEQARLDLEKDSILEDLKQRNDNPAQIARREWQWLMYGNEHFSGRMITGDSLEAIEREDLLQFHRDYFRPENMIVRVAGDVDTAEVLKMLESRFADWPAGGGKEVPWPPPPPRHQPTPGVYSVQKDIPQGRVQIGHLGLQREGWDDPRGPALAVMNDVLGGGGFTSRITQRVRSDEGLAYSAGSSFRLGDFWPGTFSVFYQSKSETVPLAAKIALEEVDKIRNQPISDQELETSKASFIQTFPQSFDSAHAIAGIFAGDEYLGRPHSYWYDYRDRISKVTKEDVLKVARENLHPDQMLFLVVGDWPAIEKGDADERASMADFFGGQVNVLPQRDPVSLEPVANPE